MALNPSEKWPSRTTAADNEYPYGSSKDETAAGERDGTPYEKVRADDVFGFQQALLVEAGIVPSGNADTVLESQYLEALKAIFVRVAHLEDTSNPHNVTQEQIGYTAADILTKLKTVDGEGSGIDADTVDGFHTGKAGLTTDSHIPTINIDGVMEIGNIVDFHTLGDGVDHVARLTAGPGSLFIDGSRLLTAVSSFGTRTTTGSWSITGLSTNVPLHIQCNSTSSNTEAPTVQYLVTSGASEGSTGGTRSTWSFSHDNDRFNATPHSCVIIPTSTTVIINVVTMPAGFSLTAYQ
jgi:hypothetical protein